MIVETRKTAQGTEYWDNKEKRSLFVPAGNKPRFEVATNYDSMIGGVDLANGKDKTVVNGQVVNPALGFEEMTVKQLKEYAAANDIDIPKDITKRDDIIDFLAEWSTVTLMAAATR